MANTAINGTNLKNCTYNGSTVKKIVLNGTTVWNLSNMTAETFSLAAGKTYSRAIKSCGYIAVRFNASENWSLVTCCGAHGGANIQQANTALYMAQIGLSTNILDGINYPSRTPPTTFIFWWRTDRLLVKVGDARGNTTEGWVQLDPVLTDPLNISRNPSGCDVYICQADSAFGDSEVINCPTWASSFWNA